MIDIFLNSEDPDYVTMRLENLGHYHNKIGVPIELMVAMSVIVQQLFGRLFLQTGMPEDCAKAWPKVGQLQPRFDRISKV